MIHASRTAFQEQPNGDLVCTITIDADDRSALFDAIKEDDSPIAIYLSSTPVTLESVSGSIHDLQANIDAIRERMGTIPSAGRSLYERAKQAASEVAEDFVVDLHGEAETADKPPTQTIGAQGADTASVIEAVASGAHHWDHPAARHLDSMFRHEPFQVFALERMRVDAFTGPMEAASRLINKKIKGKPIDVGMAAMARTMDEYMAWTVKHGLPMWPEKKA